MRIKALLHRLSNHHNRLIRRPYLVLVGLICVPFFLCDMLLSVGRGCRIGFSDFLEVLHSAWRKAVPLYTTETVAAWHTGASAKFGILFLFPLVFVSIALNALWALLSGLYEGYQTVRDELERAWKGGLRRGYGALRHHWAM